VRVWVRRGPCMNAPRFLKKEKNCERHG
jgi:hypothetical protein